MQFLVAFESLNQDQYVVIFSVFNNTTNNNININKNTFNIN